MGTGICAFLLHLGFFLTVARASRCGSKEFKEFECLDPHCTLESEINKELDGKLNFTDPAGDSQCAIKEQAEMVFQATAKALKTLEDEGRETLERNLELTRKLIHRSIALISLEQRLINLESEHGEAFHLAESLPKDALKRMLTISRFLIKEIGITAEVLRDLYGIQPMVKALQAHISILSALRQTLVTEALLIGNIRESITTTPNSVQVISTKEVRTSKVKVSGPRPGMNCWLICDLITESSTKIVPTQKTTAKPKTKLKHKTTVTHKGHNSSSTTTNKMLTEATKSDDHQRHSKIPHGSLPHQKTPIKGHRHPKHQKERHGSSDRSASLFHQSDPNPPGRHKARVLSRALDDSI